MLAFIPYVPPQPPSPRAEELAQRLAETIEQYRQQNPDLNRTDVAQATRLAVARAGVGAPGVSAPLIAVVVGLLLAGLFAMLATDGGGCPAQAPVMMIAIAFAIAVAAVLLVVLKRR